MHAFHRLDWSWAFYLGLPPQVKITLVQSLQTDFLNLLHTALQMPPLEVLLVSNFGGNFRDFLSD